MAAASNLEELNRHRRILGRVGADLEEANAAAVEARRRTVLAVIEATAAGLSTREIADLLGLSHTTVAKMAQLALDDVGVDL